MDAFRQLGFEIFEDIEIDDPPTDIRYPDITISLGHFEIELILDSINHYRNTVVKDKNLIWASKDAKIMKTVNDKLKIAQSKTVNMKLQTISHDFTSYFVCPDCDEEKMIEQRRDEKPVVYCDYCGERMHPRKDIDNGR